MKRDRLKNILTILALFVSSASILLAQSEPSFLTNRTKGEFDALIEKYTAEFGRAINGDTNRFKHLALPYSPLDLQIKKAKNYEEASYWRNIYGGVAGAAAKVDPIALVNSFECGWSCVDYRKSDLIGKLPKILELVKEFNDAPQIELIANWGIEDEYRVNNVFHMLGGRTREALPSPIMGFVPSGKWRKLDSIEKYFDEIKISKTKFDSLITKTKELGLVTVMRNPNGDTKVIRVGIFDCESGLLFLKQASSKPVKGQKTPDGKEYVYIEEIKPNIFFYETS